MDLARKGFDLFYDLIKPLVFRTTAKDPEKAHELFILFAETVHRLGLESLLLDNTTNAKPLSFEFSNAAGFNKNAEIAPTFLKHLGFNRAVIGTVTYDPWAGNPRPRTQRFIESRSLVNWMGLPGIGARAVAERLNDYGHHGVPITINLMATPGKKGDEVLKDLSGTMNHCKYLPCVDRFELNVSCPNTHGSTGGIDARREYQGQLSGMLAAVSSLLLPTQELYLKVSPDLDRATIEETVDISRQYNVRGFTTANTTTNHNRHYIPLSPGKGGASGQVVYSPSLQTQRGFKDVLADRKYAAKLIACGGIDTPLHLQERLSFGAEGIQIYTPLIFEGTRILRTLRAADPKAYIWN